MEAVLTVNQMSKDLGVSITPLPTKGKLSRRSGAPDSLENCNTGNAVRRSGLHLSANA